MHSEYTIEFDTTCSSLVSLLFYDPVVLPGKYHSQFIVTLNFDKNLVPSDVYLKLT